MRWRAWRLGRRTHQRSRYALRVAKDLRPGKGVARPTRVFEARRAPQLALEGGEASEHGEHQTLCGPIAPPCRLLPRKQV
jgi:hypothetical protein